MWSITPKLTENGKTTDLQNCTYDQTERLYTMMTEKLDLARQCSNTGANQLEDMVRMVQDRLDAYDSGGLTKEEPKRPDYKGVRVRDDAKTKGRPF